MVKLPQFPRFRGFAGETKLHGIRRTVEGSWTSIGLWSVVAIVCIGMAINDLITMVGQYRSDQVAIQVSLQDNTNYTWPTPTLCMEIVQNFYHYDETLAEHSSFNNPSYVRDSIERLMDNFTRFFGHLDSVGNYSEIAADTIAADRNHIYYPYLMLGYLLQLEQNLLGTYQQYLADYQFSFAANDPYALSDIIDSIYSQYRLKNVTMEKLTRWIGMLHCLSVLIDDRTGGTLNVEDHFENYRYFGDPQYIQLSFCRADLITQLGFGMVCTKLFKEPNVPIRPGYNFFTIFEGLLIDPTELPLDSSDVDAVYARSAEIKVIPNLQWHLDLHGRDTVPVDRSGIFSWNPSEYVVLDIWVNSEYKFFNRRTHPCSNAVETQYQCQWRKRLELVQRQCGCWPTLADISNTNVSKADSCNNLITSGLITLVPSQFCPAINLTQLDTSDCLPDCHVTNFKLTRQQSSRMLDPDDESNSYRGQFEFRFIAEESQLIEEKLMYDWNNFMGQWGGSIGTWLGASILSFVHIPVYLLRQLFGSKKKVVESGEKVEETSTSA